MRKTMFLLGVLTVLSHAGGDMVSSKKDSASCQMNGWYLYGLGGYGAFQVHTNLVNISESGLRSGALDDGGIVYEVGIGYTLRSSWFAEIAYQRSSLDLIHMDTLYGSLNYAFTQRERSIRPYVGLLLGYSRLTWEKRPYRMLINEDLTSTGVSYGIQLGIEMKLTRNTELLARYQYINLDQKMVILTDNIIDHKAQRNLMIGIKYEF